MTNPVIPPWHTRTKDSDTDTDFDILTSATDVIGGYLQTKSAEFAPWAWKVWDKWYALAVALAEMCGTPHGPKADRAFAVAERYFSRYAHLVHDPDSQRSWRPVGKLMARVRVLRGNNLNLNHNHGLSHGHDLNLNPNPNPNPDSTKNVPLLRTPEQREEEDDDDDDDRLDGLLMATPTSITHVRPDHLDPSAWESPLDQTQYRAPQQTPPPTTDFNPSDDIPWLNWTLFLEDMNSPILDPL